MTTSLLDVYRKILKYNNHEVYIAFHYETNEPYFNAKQVCKMLEYLDCRDALRTNVLKENIFYLKDIVKNYKILYKNAQGHSKFINEAGLNSIILKSKQKNALEISRWITEEVMPSIRKYGEYKLQSKEKKLIDELNELLNQKKEEIEILKHNLRKEKFKKGNSVYIIRAVENTLDLKINEKIYMKFGKTKNMNSRKLVYDTAHKNKTQILKHIKVKDSSIIEKCVLDKMKEYTIKKNKEMFYCSFNDIINVVDDCIYFYEKKHIDKLPNQNINVLSREFIFDKNKKIEIEFLNDEQFDKLFTNINKDNKLDDETDDILSSEESETDDEKDIQYGGNGDYLLKYLEEKMKYLRLKYELT